MKSSRQYLVYLAGAGPGCPALQRAARWARATDAELVVVQVVPDEVRKLGDVAFQRVKSAYRVLAAEAVREMRDEGIVAESRLLLGKPFLEIIRETQRSDIDLVFKTAEGTGVEGQSMFGSTALHLLRKASCPIWIVHPEQAAQYRRIVVAVDPASNDPAARRLAIDILRLGAQVAKAEDARLEVVHAWWLWSEKVLRGSRVGLPPEQVEEMLDTLQEQARKGVAETVEAAEVHDAVDHLHVAKGPPARIIGDQADGADLVVMGTVSRAGIPGLLIGNTAERVLQSLQTSLLTIKPSGFESPVR